MVVEKMHTFIQWKEDQNIRHSLKKEVGSFSGKTEKKSSALITILNIFFSKSEMIFARDS